MAHHVRRRSRALEHAPAESGDDERRHSQRFVASVPVAVRQRGSKQRRARTWNLAERGVCLNVRSEILVGQRIELDMEVIMPTRVRMGYNMDALVIDGPAVSYFARLPGIVRRIVPCPDGSWDLGVEFCAAAEEEHLRIVDLYLDHLRDGFRSQFD